MVACGPVFHPKQIVSRCLRWTAGRTAAQFCQVLRGNPSEDGANFAKLSPGGTDQVTYKITQRLIKQIRRSLKANTRHACSTAGSIEMNTFISPAQHTKIGHTHVYVMPYSVIQ